MIRMYILTLCLLFVVGCQSTGNVSESSDIESRFADKQDREAYENSPAYLNVQLGAEYMRQGQLETALAKLKKALRQSPQLAVAHNTIGVLYQRMGEPGLAENHFRRSVELDSNDPRIRNNYGQFLCSRGKLDEAIEQFDIAANNPLYKTPYLPKANAGMCALSANDMGRADKYLRDALQKRPRLKLALGGMLKLSVETNNYVQGKAYLQRYLEVGKHTVETLWYGYLIESSLGNTDVANNYAVRLKTRYPDSNQTRLLLERLNTP